MRVVVEETRVHLGGGFFQGRWDLPRLRTPPFPLAALLPDGPDRDLDGTQSARPRLRPFLELSRAVLFRDIATFRYEPPQGEAFGPSLVAAWAHACRHPQASRQRVALVTFGAKGWREAASRMGALRAAAEPLAAILVAPGPAADLSPLEGVPIRLIDGEDLTEHLQKDSDWLGGRSIPHPGVLAEVADGLADLLRPKWERATRPPGTAIGE